MSSNDDTTRMHTMRTLIMFVARAFYDTRYVVVLDQLAKHEVLKDDELAARCGLNNKDLSKLTTRLIADGLITVYRQNTSRTGETMARIVSKGFYYIDQANFCNIVKWRVAEMRRRIDAKLRNELAQQGYVCPVCRKTFEPLDAIHLSRGDGFYCDDCGTELIDNSNKEDQAGKANRLQRFNKQTEKIVDGLKRSEEMVMPKVDIVDWIKKHPTITTPANGEPKQEDGLAVAGVKSITQKQVYEVVLTADDTEERAAKKAREQAASARKVQNAMPSWHTRSTVTGDLTSFGLQNADAEASASAGAYSGAESKPAVDHEVQKASIAEYYAKLEAESQANSPMDTDNAYDYDGLRPGGSSRSSALAVPMAGLTVDRAHISSPLKRKVDFEPDPDDVPRSTKHSRNTSYQSSPASDMAPTPLLRSESRDTNASSNTSPGSSTTGGWRDKGAGIAIVVDDKRSRDPIVFVNGVATPLSQVTDEHHELMTPEEYEKYAELLMGDG
ncbi:hypothetical protein FRB94_013410 [Tulasnella sp. JGI-2019a]|nr:hypothetical protein FRB93_002479 [Tulasnella sp. JGI-2019a]KAG9008363.1 hypothetical protein FRB94_013410 [Tulasnella sp. JGI-2019a]KAG9037812.1 hypothetical protein FRB95_004099 [Tulasnella sp. JGI-2019a]